MELLIVIQNELASEKNNLKLYIINIKTTIGNRKYPTIMWIGDTFHVIHELKTFSVTFPLIILFSEFLILFMDDTYFAR